MPREITPVPPANINSTNSTFIHLQSLCPQHKWLRENEAKEHRSKEGNRPWLDQSQTALKLCRLVLGTVFGHTEQQLSPEGYLFFGKPDAWFQFLVLHIWGSKTTHIQNTPGQWETFHWTLCSLHMDGESGWTMLLRSLSLISKTMEAVLEICPLISSVPSTLFSPFWQGESVECQLKALKITTSPKDPRVWYFRDCASDHVACNTGRPQRIVPSLHPLHLRHNPDNLHFQCFSFDNPITVYTWEGNNQDYKEVITDFVSWCEVKKGLINTTKPKEMLTNLCRFRIPDMDIKTVEENKYYGVNYRTAQWTQAESK